MGTGHRDGDTAPAQGGTDRRRQRRCADTRWHVDDSCPDITDLVYHCRAYRVVRCAGDGADTRRYDGHMLRGDLHDRLASVTECLGPGDGDRSATDVARRVEHRLHPASAPPCRMDHGEPIGTGTGGRPQQLRHHRAHEDRTVIHKHQGVIDRFDRRTGQVVVDRISATHRGRPHLHGGHGGSVHATWIS